MVAGERDEMVDGKTQGGKVAQLCADDAEYDIETETLFHHGGTEASLFVLVGEVNISNFLEAAPFSFSQKRAGEALGVLRSEGRMVVPDRSQAAIAAPGWGISSREVNVRAIILYADSKVFIDVSKDLMFGHEVKGASRNSGVMAMWKP